MFIFWQEYPIFLLKIISNINHQSPSNNKYIEHVQNNKNIATKNPRYLKTRKKIHHITT